PSSKSKSSKSSKSLPPLFLPAMMTSLANISQRIGSQFMRTKDIPFNVTLIDPKNQRLPASRQITTREPFEGGTQNYHPNGLFSIPIFGRIGSDERDRLFGYIELNTTVLH